MSNKTHMRAPHGREQKREQFFKPARQNSTWLMLVVIVGLLAVIAYLVAGREPQGPAITTASSRVIQVTSGMSDVRIPLNDVNSGQAKFFEAVLPSNTTARFFVIRTSDGVYRVALDACEVCYGSQQGYYQDGDLMVCRKCGRHFAVNTVNDGATGCHPIGLSRKVVGSDLVIPTAELERGSQYF